MFEKEAEYYAREKYSHNTELFIIAVADDAFKDGAEFGYNKGYHDAEEEVEHWREDVCNAFNLPVDMLFPVKEKIGKYNFVHDKKPKVYISGQITGLSEKEYKNNFNSAELYLTGLGYDVVNPVAYDPIPNGTWSDYMRRDIKLLMDCDYIYMLDNWTESTGAKAEFRLAVEIGIERLKLDT